jgi:hypothetical protein
MVSACVTRPCVSATGSQLVDFLTDAGLRDARRSRILPAARESANCLDQTSVSGVG